MLSICVTVKNRSRVEADGLCLELFPNCVASLSEAELPSDSCELVISDWGSDDWPLADWLDERSGGLPTRTIQMEGDFCRGRGRNAAAKHCKGEYLFFLDADCLVRPAVLNRGLHVLAEGGSYFPIVYSFEDASHTTGWWRSKGFGNCMLSRQVFEESGGWPEYRGWGKEDDVFFARIEKLTPIVRENAPGLLHQWHPDTISWKDRFRQDKEINRVRTALEELWSVVPSGETLILIDEGRFGGHEQGAGRTVLPFPEREGIYWGLPADDRSAIAELRRMKKKGARFLALEWNSFWWLEHYERFAKVLNDKCSCCLNSRNLRVFDLESELLA